MCRNWNRRRIQGGVPCSALNFRSNSKWLGEELRNKGVPNLWIPKQIKQVKEIPVLGTGKLDLQKLKELAEA